MILDYIQYYILVVTMKVYILSQGDSGQGGQRGEQGLQGPPGVSGMPGSPGESGNPGRPGRDGDPGIKGDLVCIKLGFILTVVTAKYMLGFCC